MVGEIVCVNYQSDTDKVNIVLYRYQNNTYLKDTERELKLTEYEELLAKRIYLLSNIDIFYIWCIVLDGPTVNQKSKLRQDWIFSF